MIEEDYDRYEALFRTRHKALTRANSLGVATIALPGRRSWFFNIFDFPRTRAV